MDGRGEMYLGIWAVNTDATSGSLLEEGLGAGLKEDTRFVFVVDRRQTLSTVGAG